MNLTKNLQAFRLLLVCCVCFTLGVSRLSAQDQKVSLNATNTKLIKILQKIEKQTKYLFVYGDEVDVTRPVSITVKQKPLSQVLNRLFGNTNIAYAIEKSNIVLTSSKEVKKRNVLVRGNVKDSNGDLLIGVTIMIKGQSKGTITDIDGNYQINIDEVGAKTALVYHYVGYSDQVIAVGNKKQINVVLKEQTTELDGIVVTAMGIKREEKALSYNVQQLSGDDMLVAKDANFINSLSGKVAGVTINSSSSGVGGASKVVMRGTKGIAQSSNALYVIDGVPMYNTMESGGTGSFSSEGSTEAIADINPEDIESMSVLTGAAAAALYGSHASNGAIIITTKKGRAGKVEVTVTSNTEYLSALVSPEFQNRYGTGDLLSDVPSIEKSWGNKLTPYNSSSYDPFSDYLKTGHVQTETISLSAGNDKNQTYLSASIVNSDGIVPNNAYDRYNFTFRNTTKFLNDKMTLDVGASYIKQNDRNMINQGTYLNPLVTAYLFPRGGDWNAVKMYERYDAQRKISTQFWNYGLTEYNGQNPYWVSHRNIRENHRDRYALNASLSYDILEWLNVSGRVRLDNSNSEYEQKLYASTNTTITDGAANGLYGYKNVIDKQTYADFMVNINKNWEDLSLVGNIGASISDVRQKGREIRGGIADDLIPNVFNEYQIALDNMSRKPYEWVEQTQSIFASLELGWKHAVYLTLTARNDWPSQLAGPNSSSSSFFYPSAGLSVVLSELIDMPSQIDFMKIRGSFASVGMPFQRFLANPTYTWDESKKTWKNKTHYPMYNLKPERTNSFEVGLTTRLFKHFDIDFSFYNTRTYNQTFDPHISVSSGYSTIFLQTGNVENRGVELALGYKNEWGKFSWNSNFTLSHNRNKIIELVENYVHPETGKVINIDRLDIANLHQAHFILKKGGSLGDLYSTVDLQRDNRGNIYVDPNGNVAINNNAGDIKLGSVFPKANLGWRNSFSYKGFTLSAMLSARLGGIVYSSTQAAMDQYGVSKATADARDLGYVLVNGQDRLNPEKWYTAISNSGGLPQYYTYDATNVRLQEASLSYSFPLSISRFSTDVTLSLVGRNLWMIYCKAPFDPESVASTGNYYQGMDNFIMPSTRSIGFNVRLKF